ncbi:NAD(P)-dependent oxidoreductase [Nanoarchaeota archaeon]
MGYVVGIPDGLEQVGVDVLKQAGIDELIEKDEALAMGPSRLQEEADAIIVRSATKVNSVPKNNRTKLYGRGGSGVDNFDGGRAQIEKRKLPIVNIPEPNGISVSEMVINTLLTHSRPLQEAYEYSRQGNWNKKGGKGHLIYGKTLGIVGGGHIGSEVFQRADAFGMRVLVSEKFPQSCWIQKRFPNAEFVSLDELMENSDFVTVHVPKQKRYVIGRKDLDKAKPGQIFMDFSRGGVVAEKALLAILQESEHNISGVYRDVWSAEPFQIRPYDGSPPKKKPSSTLRKLLKHPKLLGATAHLGASTVEGQRMISEGIATKIVNFLQWGYLSDAVNCPINPEQAYRGLMHRAGMFIGQYLQEDISSTSIVVDGRLAGAGESALEQLATSYLCGLTYTREGPKSPLYVIDTGIKSDVRAGDLRKPTKIKYDVKTVNGTSFHFEVDYDNEQLTQIGINGKRYSTGITLADSLVVAEHANLPGALAAMDNRLAEAGINIAGSRNQERDERALTVYRIRSPVGQDFLDNLKQENLTYKGNPIELTLARSVVMPSNNAF